MKPGFGLLAALLTLVAVHLHAEAVKDREGAVRKDRETLENDKRWIYNDWQRGFAEARSTGKPLLVVLRCVPCLACAGIDASVLTEPELAPLLDRFVCVRVINANALDLSLFQVDFDLSFSSVIFNADGTVIGRYGSWVHQKNSQDKTTAGFRRSLNAALELNSAYPGNKAALVGKQGGEVPYRSTLDIPGLNGKYKLELDWNGKVVPSCVHCHQIGESMRKAFLDKGQKIPEEMVYPWPAPETVGISLAPDFAARVEKVAEGSLAAKAGLKPGDDILSASGQPLVSAADLSWVLHRTASAATVPVRIKRGASERTIDLKLAEGWRRGSDISRRVGTWQLRGIASGGLQLELLSAEARKERGIAGDRMALLVKHAGEYGIHAAAKKAGFRKDDVLIEVDGSSTHKTEGQLLGDLLRTHRAGDQIPAKVLRGSEKLELAWPMQ